MEDNAEQYVKNDEDNNFEENSSEELNNFENESTENESEDTENSFENQDDTPEDLPQSVKKRIGMQSKKINALQRRLERFQEENNHLRNSYMSGQARSGSDEPGEYDEDIEKHLRINMMIDKARDNIKKEEKFKNIINNIKSKDDYYEIEDRARDVPVTHHMRSAFMELSHILDEPENVIYEVLKDVNELKKLSGMSEKQIISRVSMLSAKMANMAKKGFPKQMKPLKPEKDNLLLASNAKDVSFQERRNQLRASKRF
jgi:hypothetical protein